MGAVRFATSMIATILTRTCVALECAGKGEVSRMVILGFSVALVVRSLLVLVLVSSWQPHLEPCTHDQHALSSHLLQLDPGICY